MLTLLQIENVAVIASADIVFKPGFNVLTGETGAGKSIIIDSVAALSGERTSRELVRTGSDYASVSGVFDCADFVAPILEDAGIQPEPDGSLFISRRITADGRNLCRVNGRTAPLSLLRRLGELLIRSHGQHDSRGLLDPALHIELLDRYAGTQELLAEYKAELARLKEIRSAQRELARDEDEKQRRIELLNYRIAEIGQADLVPGEEEQLTARRAEARDAKNIIKACLLAAEALNGGENGSASDMALKASKDLLSLKKQNQRLSDLANRLDGLSSELSDVADEIRKAAEETGFSEASLDEIEDRLSLISTLKRKYGGSIESVNLCAAESAAELETILRSDAELERLAGEYADRHKRTSEIAKRLSDERKSAAKRLEKAVEEELSYLCMAGARFEVRFERQEREGRTVFAPDGTDIVEFYISANRGETVKPLARTASGGELSRIMLALNTVLSPKTEPTVIYDEVDSGISGVAALRVAERLARTASTRQVLCVTHLSQMASFADAHFLIKKAQQDGRTFTSVEELDREGRLLELARINGGAEPTETMKLAAAEQIADAERVKQGR